jgi:hypothetical protein
MDFGRPMFVAKVGFVEGEAIVAAPTGAVLPRALPSQLLFYRFASVQPDS